VAATSATTACAAQAPGRLVSKLVESLDYEVDLFTTLQSFRVLFLRYYEWLDTGSSSSYAAWQAASPAYREAVATHEERWRGNLDRPPDNFFAANAGLAHAERAPAARVAAWVLAGVALLALPGLERR